MKKLLIIYFLLISTLFASVAKVSAIRGTANITRENQIINIQKGSEILEMDTINVSNKSKMQIIFKDRTIITLGSNTTFNVKEYTFEENKKPKVNLNLTKGTFSAITGKIAKIFPSRFKMKLKTSTIGIRGTHFLGTVTDKQEIVACTKGEIYVESMGESVTVMAGEITSFLHGNRPQTPRELKEEDLKKINKELGLDPALKTKLESVKLNKDLSLNKEKISNMVNEISSIKNADTRMAALNTLEDNLNKQLDNLAQNYANKVEMTGEPVGETTWGFYTTNESTGNTIDSVINDKPDDVWREGKQTDSSVVDNYKTNHNLLKYSGKNLGFITDVDKYGKIIDNDNNKVELSVDHVNKSLQGYISFDAIDPNSGESKFWKIYIASVGDTIVNPTGYDIVDFSDNSISDGSQSIDYAKLFFNRYYGLDADQLSSYFKYYSADETEAYGLFIANKTDKVTLEKLEIGSNANDSIDSWGYWTETTSTGTSDNEIKNALPHGAWIEGRETTADEIASFVEDNPTASYNGEIFGTVYHPKTASTSLISNGVVKLDFDFSNSSVSGDISFDAGVDRWSVAVDDGIVSGTNFSGTTFSDNIDATITTTHQQFDGKFYGSDANSIGGTFGLSGANGDLAIGGFKGTK